MMEIRVLDDIVGAERNIARETRFRYRRDREDSYKLHGTRKDYNTWELVFEYYIVEMKVNPDYDW